MGWEIEVTSADELVALEMFAHAVNEHDEIPEGTKLALLKCSQALVQTLPPSLGAVIASDGEASYGAVVSVMVAEVHT